MRATVVLLIAVGHYETGEQTVALRIDTITSANEDMLYSAFVFIIIIIIIIIIKFISGSSAHSIYIKTEQRNSYKKKIQ